MEQLFSDTFPNLEAKSDLKGLFPLMTVKRLLYSKDKKSLFLHLTIHRICGKKTVLAVEKLINEQVMPEGTACSIVENYELPTEYTLKDLMDAYWESLIIELADGSSISRRFLEKADYSVLDENTVALNIENHPLAKLKEKEWRKMISGIFMDRFGFTVEARLSFDKESKRIPNKDRDDVVYFDEPKKVETPKDEMLEMPGSRGSKKNSSENISENISSDASGKSSVDKADSSSSNSANDSSSSKSANSSSSSKPANSSSSSKTAPGKSSGNRATPGSLNQRSGFDKGRVRTPVAMLRNDDPNVLYGRDFNDELHSLEYYGEALQGNVAFKGVIFSVESRELRNGKFMYLFAVTDYTDSVMVKMFINPEDIDTVKARLKEGVAIRLKGLADYDAYDKEVSIRNVAGIVKIEENFITMREDRAPVKRVELHCHTKASTNDGLTDPERLIKTAKAWGHKSIAITDHGNAYGFPMVHHVHDNVKNPDFKIIYGLEGYLVDDEKEVVRNAGNQALSQTCVVFDLETTGISPVQNRIIEIGAVKVRDGEILERYSVFVNPMMPIPYRIEQLTGISDSMVKDAKPIAEILPEFLAFCEGCFLVGHNVGFDISFIEENIKRLGLSHEPFTTVDTLPISSSLLPYLKNHKLDTVAKELNVSLENHHRAVDDAECTAQIYLKLVSRLKARNLTTLKEIIPLGKMTDEQIRNAHSYHIILLAKNNDGRVNLYRLISDSCLKYFGGRPGRPKIPRSLLNERREGLILGSACSAGELFEAVLEGKTEDHIKKIVDFYDYLEVQPLGNNQYLIDEDKYDIHTKEELQNLNKEIIRLGDTYGKPVCATGDVHFLNPDDAIYRAILQAGSGYRESEDQPPLYYRTTDEMIAEFSYLGAEKAYEIVVENTNMIADRIESINPVRPDKCPPVIEHADEDLRTACYKKAHEWYGDPLPKIVEDRLEKELHSIIGNGYAVMYMIAQKLVSKSESDGYLVGSRGSVGSSFAATMSGITEVNPLQPHYRCPSCQYSDFDSEEVKKYLTAAGCDMPDKVCPKCGKKMIKDGFNIPFETFLGFKGDKEPDIDLNFSSEYQSKAHAFTEVIFGKGQTFHAGTVGTVAQNTAIGYTLHYFEDRNMVKRNCEVTRLAKNLEGVVRTSGQHPGGIVVLPFGQEINTFTPIQHPANDPKSPIITTMFEYHSINHNLLKLDILGHNDPTMLRMLEDLTGLSPRSIPLDSPEVMQLFKDTSSLGLSPEDIRGTKLGALGVPEFGTDFAMEMVISCKPEKLSDLVRIAGMAHGEDVWTGNNQVLIENGTCTIASAICCRDDIMEYLIGMGLDPALSFSIMEKVRKGKGLTPEWEEEMRAHDVPDWYIWSCKKIKYMFPKAHAAAYVMSAWRVAYYKVFYPVQYYCAYFSIRADSFNYESMCLGKAHLEAKMDAYLKNPEPSPKEKSEYDDMRIVQEMYARGLDFVPIDIKTAKSTLFTVIDDKHIMPALVSIDGMGANAADSIIEAVKDGPFISLANFKSRTKVSQTIIDKMVTLKILTGLPDDDQFSLFDLI